MKFLGNLAWLVLGGLLVAIIYIAVGLLMCITIIGIPFGVQLIKLGGYAFWPFGRELVNGPGEPGCLSTVMNLLWMHHDHRYPLRAQAFQPGSRRHIPFRERDPMT